MLGANSEAVSIPLDEINARDNLHVAPAPSSSYALWNYLTIAFAYTYPGFVTKALGLGGRR